MKEMDVKKAYINKFDIMERYNVSSNVALGIIRTIKFFNGGGALPQGKILPRELENWESRDEFNRRVYTPYSEKIPAELASYADPCREAGRILEEKRREYARHQTALIDGEQAEEGAVLND